LALDVLKERPVLWPVDVPEAEIIFVDAHLSAPHEWPTKLRNVIPIEKVVWQIRLQRPAKTPEILH
jgi:hypothetical protein